MATPGRRLDPATRRQIVRLLAVRHTRRDIAQMCHVAKRTVDKIAGEERAETVRRVNNDNAQQPA